jgi:hypothetical protein
MILACRAEYGRTGKVIVGDWYAIAVQFRRMKCFRRWLWNGLAIIPGVGSVFCLWVAASLYHLFVNGYIDITTDKIVHDPRNLVNAKLWAIPVVPLAMMPIARLGWYWVRFRSRGRRIKTFHWRHQNNLCVRCGYDVRATPDRCPECGMIASKLEAKL